MNNLFSVNRMDSFHERVDQNLGLFFGDVPILLNFGS